METVTEETRVRWRDFEFPNRVALDQESETSTYGKFTAEPFEEGFGNTIGNSLRRILLSSIEGVSPKNVRIEGVEHELSTIDGVREDVPQILSNIKQLVLNLEDSKDKHTIEIDVNREGVVEGRDVKADPAVDVVNPDQHIATLNEKVEFKAEIDIERGRGYLPREEHSENGEIGNIAVDSLFSPIRRVQYDVEDTRVGRTTDYDRLVMEIWTDGSISPENALTEAAKILRKHLNPFVQYFEIERRLEAKSQRQAEVREERQKISRVKEQLDKDLSELGISKRIQNVLEDNDYHTIEDIVRSSEDDLLEVHNFGSTSLDNVKDALEDLDLEIGMDLSEVYGGRETYFDSGSNEENESDSE